MSNNKENMPSPPKPVSYADAGVDIDAGNAVVDRIKPLVKKTARPGSNPDLGGFGGLFDLKAAGFKDPILVAANDGVGTKLKIAIETDIHQSVGIDLVAMCVNDLVVQGAEPLFFLDYLATGKLKEDQATSIISGIAEGCTQAECALIGGETAEMPGMYSKGDYDLAGFCVGAAERGELLPKKDMQEGDILIGLASSGIHSNGFSLVRKLITDNGFNWNDKCPFDSEKTLGAALLEPTRIYVKACLSAIRKTQAIKALAHITGGGLSENIPRVLPDNLSAEINLDHLNPPAVFKWFSDLGNITNHEMLRTFNCGIGMVLVVSEEKQQDVLDALEEQNETPFILGKLVKHGDEGVIYKGRLSL